MVRLRAVIFHQFPAPVGGATVGDATVGDATVGDAAGITLMVSNVK